MDEKKVMVLINKLIDLPYVKVDRYSFLTKEFGSKYEELLPTIFEKGPYKAGVPIDVIRKKCEDAIKNETLKATGASFIAGVPGGFAMFGTVPADTLQFMSHALRICQQISYLSGIKTSPIEEIENAASNEILVYLGIMLGVEGAHVLLTQLTKIAGKKITVNTLTPLLQKIATQVGFKLTVKTTGNAISKVVPILGGALSGLLTYATLKPMSKRLQEKIIENLEQEEKCILDVENTFDDSKDNN